MRNGLSQRDRVRDALIRAGAQGVSQLEFDAPEDGGAPIRRLASRVVREPLRLDAVAGAADRVALYVLVSVPERPPARPDVPLEPESVRVTVQPLDGFPS